MNCPVKVYLPPLFAAGDVAGCPRCREPVLVTGEPSDDKRRRRHRVSHKLLGRREEYLALREGTQ